MALRSVDPATGIVRGVRALVLMVPAVGATVASHTRADGCTSWPAVALAAAVGWAGAVALLGKQRGLPWLLSWVVVAQLVTHVALQARCVEAASGQAGGGGGEQLLAGATPAMLIAHSCSAVLTAGLFARADAGLWMARSLLRAGRRLTTLLRERWPRVLDIEVRDSQALPGVARGARAYRAPRPLRRGPPVLALR
jgi:hypothetical protein